MIQLFKEYYNEMIIPYYNDVKELIGELVDRFWSKYQDLICFTDETD